MSLKSFRPQGYTGKGDSHLAKIHSDLKNLLKKTQKAQHLKTLDLPAKAQDQVAGALVELAEDLHNDIGIWRSYEQYNVEWFGTPLPLTLGPGEVVDARELLRRRIHHFIWVLFPEFDPDLILSPTHDELDVVSEPITDFFIERFADVPQDSGIKKFLCEPNTYGWEVKKKLVWLGIYSYLFRYFFGNYLEDHGGQPDIATMDDFICQETTAWSGLGPIDILAALLDITPAQRHDLRHWYERHLAFFRIQAINLGDESMEVVNLINDRPYQVKVGDQITQFKPKMYLKGSLVPWDGVWYWSGEQSGYPNLSQENLRQIKQTFATRMSSIAYRYCDNLAQEAREMAKAQYDEFLKYHGSDLVLYPDGLAFAEDYDKQIRAWNESRPQEASSKPDAESSSANGSMPQEVLDHFLEMEHGVAVYFNPEEGQEMMPEFNDAIRGLEKKGVNLTYDEADSLRGFIFSDVISPAFVRRVVQKYGAESIAAAFFIEETQDDLFLEYLLRRYKGHFYRKRYPAIAIIS